MMLIFALFLFGTGRMCCQILAQEKQIKTIQEQIEFSKKQVKQLETEKKQLQNDAFIEKLARKQGLIGPDEVLYKVDD